MKPSPYRPSNSTEGDAFEARFCGRCERDRGWRDGDGEGCPILAWALALPVEHPDYPAEWVQDDQGPRCTAFEPEGKP